MNPQRVLITGHTGFKGAWLAAYLRARGVEVSGFALAPPARGAYWDLDVDGFATSVEGDVRDAAAVNAAVAHAAPDIVFHLAAQPLVRAAWSDRRTTYETNVMGTVNVVEAALACDAVRGVVVATTDKVYANAHDGRAFVETDRLGGGDPYSASKAAAELALVPYRTPGLMGLRDVPVVSVRAGNVIGGGDWSTDRLVPDVIRALEAGEKVVLRRPDATRPWQHVLDCVAGYARVATAILQGDDVADAYNFASGDGATATVLDVARAVVRAWGAPDDVIVLEPEVDGREAPTLQLDATRALTQLGWQPQLTLADAIVATVAAYRDRAVAREQVAGSLRSAD